MKRASLKTEDEPKPAVDYYGKPSTEEIRKALSILNNAFGLGYVVHLPPGDRTVVGVDFGPYGIHDIPADVFAFCMEVTQIASALSSRIPAYHLISEWNPIDTPVLVPEKKKVQRVELKEPKK